MLQKLVVALALVFIVGGSARAAESDLQQIADALDVSTTKTFQFTANGTSFQLGQSTSPAAAFPRVMLTHRLTHRPIGRPIG